MIVAVVILAVVFATLTTLTVLRFAAVVRQMLAGFQVERRQYAVELDRSQARAFADAMSALEAISDRLAASQTALLERTMDAVAGPQSVSGEPFTVDSPSLDARVRWQPDDEWDYTGLGIDPTDTDMPLPHIEPEGNEHRAVMVRPGEGLVP